MRHAVIRCCAASALVLALSATTASSELVHVSIRMTSGLYTWDCLEAIDLSAQANVGCHSPEADVAYISAQEKWWLPAFGVYFDRSAMLVLDTPFEDVTLAPMGGYAGGALIEVGKTYIVRTADPLYAKLVVRAYDGFDSIDVEYVVQTDGTRALAPGVATAVTTWGHVKALYR
ncbi:MAG TPA: hypothetical protein VF247_05625 [Candidatus Krumholzibacteria bacterium]